MKRPQVTVVNRYQDQARSASGQIFAPQAVKHFRNARRDRRSVRQVDEHYVMQDHVRLIVAQAHGVEACQSALLREAHNR